MYFDEEENGFGTQDNGMDDFGLDLFSGIDNALEKDQIIGRLNDMINTGTIYAKQILDERLRDCQDSELLHEILFYLLIFSLKIGLLISLRKAEDHGYEFNESRRY